jgi:quercetin dioxygenase-like cupin family protein/alkylhydroperoxidase/carboxymuconolactone decarboxylase family protein YurZ
MQTRPFFRAFLIALKSSFATLGFAQSDLPQTQTQTQAQTLYPLDTQETFKGPDAYFTGDVSVKMLFPNNETAHYSGAYVTFQPGARTAWHQHPAGQHMVVTSGTALTGTRDGKVIAFEKGETVWCPKDIDHWHGATPEAAMTHLVVTGSLDGENVVWKEKVSDADYQLAVAANTPKKLDIQSLTLEQQALVPISALTASGDLTALAAAMQAGLDAGLTVNEIKETQVHLYAYVGFPRALNGMGTLMKVVEARRDQGIKDPVGDAPGSIPKGQTSREFGEKVQTELVGYPVSGPLFDFSPAMNEFLQAHLFGDLFARGILDHQARELVTVAALANMDGVEPQLNAHIGMASNVGLSRQQLQDVARVLSAHVSREAGLRVDNALKAVPAKN